MTRQPTRATFLRELTEEASVIAVFDDVEVVDGEPAWPPFEAARTRGKVLTRTLRREAEDVARTLDEVELHRAVEGHPRPQLRLVQGGAERVYPFVTHPVARRRR